MQKSFNIVHLSDLHISSSEDPAHERTRNNLIKDIEVLVSTNNLNIDAITITGDTIDRGEINAYNKATEFYKQMITRLGVSSERLIIIPGNHDIPRKSMITNFMHSINIEEFKDFEKSKEHWELFEVRFKDYFNFNQQLNQTDLTRYLYGTLVKNIETENGIMQFILINSAWSCTGERDFGNILIGRWQWEEIIQLRKELPSPDISIALIHHPIEWFHPEEKNTFIRYLNEGEMDFDVLLNGHIHSANINNISNPDTSILSLISGLGYPNIDERRPGLPKVSGCRYAIYNFNLESNEVKVWLRISREDGNFSADTNLYRAGSENGHFFIPFKPIKKQINSNEKNVEKRIELDPVPIVSEWVGREVELSDLLNPKFRAIAVTGIGGQGKTTLAAEFLRRNRKKEKTDFRASIWVDCRELPDSLHNKVIYLLEALSLGEESATLYRDEKIEDTVKRLLEYLRKQRFLIIFDNIDAYIRADTEGPTNELTPLLNTILDNEHSSLVVFTCRPPFNDSRGSFYHIQLSGLTPAEGIELFKKRDIILEKENAEIYCKELVELTKGHPWWLGLIAGQVRAGQDTLKKCVSKFSKGEVELRGRIKEYFGDVWKHLNKESQKILRYLVESSRPLTEAEILQVVELGPSKAKQNMRRLVRLGLLEPHEGTIEVTAYQVHPLIKEFVHENFTPASQKPYVYKILCVFIHPTVVSMVFQSQKIEHDKLLSLSPSPKSIVDAIETCLNSRNGVQALAILEGYYILLYDSGYHHEFTSLACRVLDLLDWEKEKITSRSRSISMLKSLVKHLSYMGQFTRSNSYLKKYEYFLEPQTLQYLDFLEIKTHVIWLQGDYKNSVNIAYKMEELADKFNLRDKIMNTLSLAIRDAGQYEKAFELFKKENNDIKDDTNKATSFGNMSRCLFELGRYEEAEELLRKSLLLLLDGTDYNSKLNTGYAYLWLAEILYKQEKFKETSAFLSLLSELWGDYAPGLLSRQSTQKVITDIMVEDYKLSKEEIIEIKKSFLTANYIKI